MPLLSIFCDVLHNFFFNPVTNKSTWKYKRGLMKKLRDRDSTAPSCDDFCVSRNNSCFR